MSSYLDESTLQEKLEAYQSSEDFEMDISILKDDYARGGGAVPTDDELRTEALNAHREWLESVEICQAEGHQLEETADGENGISNLYCDRCGFSQTMQW